MPAIGVALVMLVFLVAVFSTVWAWQLRTEDVDMIDPVWTFSLGAVVSLYAGLETGSLPTRLLVDMGSAVWGVRLGQHLWQRGAGKPEDARYHGLHQEWGAAAPRDMLGFFQVQAAVSAFLSVAFAMSSYHPDSPDAVAITVAIALWLVVVVGEALTDR